MPPGHLKWLDNLLWKIRRWNARQDCESHHLHEHIDNEIHAPRTGTFVRVTWCRRCSHVEWID